MSASSNDVQDALDSEFRQILLVIKQNISHIDDNFHIEKYKVWLERLSDASPAEKFERNKYLVELANQIHDNVLKHPFLFNPPHGPLPKLKHFVKGSVGGMEWPYHSSRSSRIDQNQHSKRHVKIKDISPQKRRNSKIKTIARPFQKLGKSTDNSSWCDLTESASSFKLACGDTDDENDTRKPGEQHQKEGLQLQEQFMRKYEEDSESSESCSSKTQIETVEDGAASYGHSSEDEVEALKERMKDLIEVKNALRDTHCLTEDRKKTIQNLQLQLITVERQSAEYKSLLEEQTKKVVELERGRTKDMSEFRERFTSARQQEIDLLKKHHTDVITQLEKSHNTKLSTIQNEFQEKITALKRQYEERIKEITESKVAALKAKDEEICRLQNERTFREEPDNQNEQIISLKKCISKLDKLMHKNERDYVKKIEKLKQELEVRNMTSQVQLQTQRADLIVRNTASKQEELQSALNSLEGKYTKMMETLQMNALESKKQDEKVIQELKMLLDKHNIAY